MRERTGVYSHPGRAEAPVFAFGWGNGSAFFPRSFPDGGLFSITPPRESMRWRGSMRAAAASRLVGAQAHRAQAGATHPPPPHPRARAHRPVAPVCLHPRLPRGRIPGLIAPARVGHCCLASSDRGVERRGADGQRQRRTGGGGGVRRGGGAVSGGAALALARATTAHPREGKGEGRLARRRVGPRARAWRWEQRWRQRARGCGHGGSGGPPARRPARGARGASG